MNLSARPAAPIDPARRYVRVRGERRGLIEFDFAIGEPELFVELMLAPAAFAEFCRIQQAVRLDAAPEPQDWRLSGVGPRDDRPLHD